MATTLVVAPITFTELSEPIHVTEDYLHMHVDIIASSDHRYEDFGEAEELRQITKRSQAPSFDQIPPALNQIPQLKQITPFEQNLGLTNLTKFLQFPKSPQLTKYPSSSSRNSSSRRPQNWSS